jgi:hypothetical protein
VKKTKAEPGKPVVMKLREDEEELVTDWINEQDVHSDSIRFLIQKEIAENGIRNLQMFIPRARSVESIRSQLRLASPVITADSPPSPAIPSVHVVEERDQSMKYEGTSQITSISGDLDGNTSKEQGTPEQGRASSPSDDHQDEMGRNKPLTEKSEDGDSENPEHDPGGKRKAGKKFSEQVIHSYS